MGKNERVSGMLAAVVFVGLCAGQGKAGIKIGQREQLFLDDYIIERTENITRRVNQAKKLPEPVIEPEYPWEGGCNVIFGTAMYDEEDKIFKMWYYVGGGHMAYATSKDGFTWEKPKLDIVTKEGEKTNIVIERDSRWGYFCELFGVVKDNRDPDPARRYKVAFESVERTYSGENEDPYHRGQRRGLGTAVSPDGIHWTLEDDFVNYEICDISRFFWDSISERYILYGRTKLTADKNDGRWASWGWGRAVIRLESKDFHNWSGDRNMVMLAADHKDAEGAEIYSMAAFDYEGVYIGLVQMFYGLPTQGNLEIQLAVSRDSREFTRVEPRDAFIPEGEVGTWDRFNISTGRMPPVTVGDEMWFYYSGWDGPHDAREREAAIGLGKVRLDRMMGWYAHKEPGKLLTRPFLVEGDELEINARTHPKGSISVAVLNEQGQELEGYAAEDGIPFEGDDVRHKFAWREGRSLGALRGQNVRLRFVIALGEFYAFRVA